MSEITYLDFDLVLEGSGSEGQYRARLLNSPSGQASVSFSLPFSELELENFLLRVGRTRRGIRRLESPEMAAAKEFGGRLFDAVFDDDMLASFRSSLDAAHTQNAGLRVRLRLRDAPELADLPWEYLYQKTTNRFLVLSKDTPIVRYLELPQRVRPLVVSPPLRLLVMISSPTDYAQLDVEAEQSKLKESLGHLERRGLVAIKVVKKATLPNLLGLLRKGKYHIFHFIGHGGFDERSQDGILLLENDSKQGRRVSGQELGTLLRDHRPLRLVVLNACEGARTSRVDPFSGVAQTLVQQGIPAVVAMQFEITDKAAITFASELYAAVADGYPMDAAVAEARKAIFAQGNDVEWGTPVLHMRAPNGQIFDVQGAAVALEPKRPAKRRKKHETALTLDKLYTKGLSYFYTEEWDEAVEAFEEIVSLREDYEDAATKLKEAAVQQKLASLYLAALSAMESRSWSEVVTHLEALVELNAGYKDASIQLEEARRQKELADLYDKARRLSVAKEWQAAVNVIDRIQAEDPDYPDKDDVFDSARREREKEDLYADGVRLLDSGKWEEALESFEAILELEPGYRETAALAATAAARKAEEEERRRADAAAKRKAQQAKKRRAAAAAKREAEEEEVRRADVAAKRKAEQAKKRRAAAAAKRKAEAMASLADGPAWVSACQADTAEAYENYAKAFPTGKYYEIAVERYRSLKGFWTKDSFKE